MHNLSGLDWKWWILVYSLIWGTERNVQWLLTGSFPSPTIWLKMATYHTGLYLPGEQQPVMEVRHRKDVAVLFPISVRRRMEWSGMSWELCSSLMDCPWARDVCSRVASSKMDWKRVMKEELAMRNWVTELTWSIFIISHWNWETTSTMAVTAAIHSTHSNNSCWRELLAFRSYTSAS